MNIKKFTRLLVLPLIVFLLAVVGCQGSVELVSEQPTIVPSVRDSTTIPATPTIKTEVLTATATAMPPTQEPLAATAVPSATVQEATEAEEGVAELITLAEAGIALDLTSALVESVTVETVPVHYRIPIEGPRYLLQPAHTVLHLAGYPESENYREPQISVYPVDAYTRLTLIAEQEIEHLQALLAAWPHPEPMPGEDNLPHLPERNAAQILHARATRLTFKNGGGIRYLTQYVQDFSPVVSKSMFYTFQGLTDDGRFYVSAVLPVGSDAVPHDIPTAQEQGFDSFTFNFDRTGYESYLAEQQAQVERLDDADFTPDLAVLDALMQSLDLTEYEGPAVEIWVPEVAPAPDQVLDDFLEAYIPAGGFPSGAHHDNPALHPDFVAAVEATVAAYRSEGIAASNYDPILMAYFGPIDLGEAGAGFERLEIGPASIDGQSASLLLERHWHYTNYVSPLRVTFAWNGEQWQITGVSSNFAAAPTEPEQVAEQLLAAIVATGGQFAGPAEWLRRVDPEIVAPNGTIQICDYIWPVGISIEGSFIQPAPLTLSSNVVEEAFVVGYLPTGRPLTVRLAQQEGVWQVTEVVCGDTPRAVALAFYSWYLGEAADAMETRWVERVPNVDGMNPGHFFVTEHFLRSASLRFDEDPYLPPAHVPNRFLVESGPQEDNVLVHLEYREEDRIELVTLSLTFVRQRDQWSIDNIESAANE